MRIRKIIALTVQDMPKVHPYPNKKHDIFSKLKRDD